MNDICIIPKPKKLEKTDGYFELKPQSRIIVSDKTVLSLSELLAEYLRPATGFGLEVSSCPNPDETNIILELKNSVITAETEKYSISATTKSIVLSAESLDGLAIAVQTLRQLFSKEIFSKKLAPGIKWLVPCVVIEDSPEYSWRGMHLDVSRHFFSVDEVCRMIDIFALHKFNKLHWHLTDDQGWRIEIKRYPKLTQIGAHRKYTLKGHMDDRPRQYDDKPYFEFYTQEDIRKVVEFAAKRHVTVIPEIDLPGHMQAAIAAYPELGCFPDRQLDTRCIWGVSQDILFPSTNTLEFMKNVFEEIINLFPSSYIHIGGDEAVKKQWEESRQVQELMFKLNIKSENALQNWFIGEINEFLQKNGKICIGWDEILDAELPANTIVMSWRDEKGAIEAARRGHNAIMAECEFSYFDFSQGNPGKEPLAQKHILTLEKVYNHDLIPEALPEEQTLYIIGGQGQLWSEYISDLKHLEYMAFPRSVALAEKLWCKHSSCCFADFNKRLKKHKQRFDIMNINYHK
jgi:hexosaminidase